MSNILNKVAHIPENLEVWLSIFFFFPSSFYLFIFFLFSFFCWIVSQGDVYFKIYVHIVFLVQ